MDCCWYHMQLLLPAVCLLALYVAMGMLRIWRHTASLHERFCIKTARCISCPFAPDCRGWGRQPVVHIRLLTQHLLWQTASELSVRGAMLAVCAQPLSHSA